MSRALETGAALAACVLFTVAVAIFAGGIAEAHPLAKLSDAAVLARGPQTASSA